MYNRYFKRISDVVLSFVIILITSPIFILTLSVLIFQNKGNPFFLQKRPGLNMKAFKVIKFKTMNDKKDENGNFLPDFKRITPIGKLIRKYSIDELPQLINVLRGEMSLIGPRPLLFKYLSLYNERQIKRHDVRPGITGWAQVNGRNSISWHQKFDFDLEYIENIEFLFDLKIFWLTILKVFKAEGVNQSDVRPMQPFDGTN